MGRPRTALLSSERIVDEALELFDSGEPFSMRALAKRLGVAAASLYYHVDGIDHLIDVIRDRMVRDDPPPAPDVHRGWREEVEAILRAMHAGYARHPRLVSALVGAPITSQSVLDLYERLASALQRAGFAPVQVAVHLEVLDSFALGVALERAAPAEVWRIASQDGALFAASRAWADPDERLDAAFEHGLHGLLDAIEAGVRSQIADA
ncbi:TetR/AcrR family transcriptional regulator [Microbacterium sp. Clip185]|uniref:TetR/AcrR family transcriptional regulator n=1 Tax=Microbacterium sp. Clip185 TaxID=3025663 RepID=UPI0023671B31|nr:TetR/AcrR family transcriptional regulator C-terminal domain-containing protein [Microbacterium sp. Clip185]WDG18411.1 TetR/AcrR family transcriptional regulator C-terminal domain-containing protein [Microbacterium sp. Clip185]